jgi:hypothetical protein
LIKSNFIVIMKQETIFQKLTVNQSNKSYLITDIGSSVHSELSIHLKNISELVKLRGIYSFYTFFQHKYYGDLISKERKKDLVSIWMSLLYNFENNHTEHYGIDFIFICFRHFFDNKHLTFDASLDQVFLFFFN